MRVHATGTTASLEWRPLVLAAILLVGGLAAGALLLARVAEGGALLLRAEDAVAGD